MPSIQRLLRLGPFGFLLASLVSAVSPAQGAIETVVVTAEKRSEASQNIPLSLSVVSGEMLDRQSVIGFQDLQNRVPSLRFGSGVTGGEDVITMRGVGSANVTSGGDSPVAYSVDGVNLARTTSVDSEFFDISRIEVLRGPQGTLYGRNSVGGSINVITNEPTDELGGYLDVKVGDYSARTFRGWANVPIVDDGDFQILARVAGVSAEHGPYQKNISTDPSASHNGDAEDFQMLRGEVLIKFSSDVDLLLTASENSEKDPVALKYAWIESPARFIGQTYYTNPRVIDANFPTNYDQTGEFYSATLNWNLGFATLTSVSGYDLAHWFQSTDGDSSGLDIAHAPFWIMNQWQSSEEVRLASNEDGSPLKWIGGFFYFNERLSQDFLFVDTGLNAPFGTGFSFHDGGHVNTKSWAPFGQIDFDLAKTSLGVPLTVTGGLRYSSDQKSGDEFFNLDIPDFGLHLSIPQVFSKSWTQLTYKAGLSYRPSDNMMAFANISTGYLSGGVLIGLGIPYQPEKVTSYEAGFKSQLFDDKVQFNLSVFREELRNMQVFVQDAAGSRIDNAGRAHDNGLEAELIAVPFDGLRLNAELSLQDAKFDQYLSINSQFAAPQPGCDPITRLCSFAGNRLEQTPPYTFDFGVEYTFDTEYGTITPRVDFFWSGEVFFLPWDFATGRQSPYTRTDLHLTWRSSSRHWSLEAFVNNLENNDVISNDAFGSTSVGLGNGLDGYTYYAPRTVGVRMGVSL